MSVHLDTPGVWEPGRSYEIPIKPRLRQAEGEGYYTQLTLHISLVRGEDSWDGEADLLALASQPQGAGSGWLWPVEGYHTLSALFGGRVHPVTGQRLSLIHILYLLELEELLSSSSSSSSGVTAPGI